MVFWPTAIFNRAHPGDIEYGRWPNGVTDPSRSRGVAPVYDAKGRWPWIWAKGHVQLSL